MVDTAWLDAYCESYASMQKENFVHEEAFLEKFKKNFLSMENMYAAGCGPCEGVAKEAALKIGETVKVVSSMRNVFPASLQVVGQKMQRLAEFLSAILVSFVEYCVRNEFPTQN